MLEHWPRIAATAWTGYQAHGRGTVTIEDGSVPPTLAYRAGAPCTCCQEMVAGYVPETHAVIAVVRSARRQVRGGPWAVGGWPTPREASEHAPAWLLGSTTH